MVNGNRFGAAMKEAHLIFNKDGRRAGVKE